MLDLAAVGGRNVGAIHGEGGAEIWDFGLIPVDGSEESNIVRARRGVADDVLSVARSRSDAVPDLKIIGAWQLESRRYALWKAPIQVLGKHLPYIWQTTGSCVGAGGANCARTSACVEILAGDPEEYRELWWPFTYGRSRFHAGMKTPGEGSFGEAYAKAATEDGFIAHADVPGLPQFEQVQGWLRLPQSVEMSWSDGDAQQSMNLLTKSRANIFKNVARAQSKDDCIAALANGYCLTQASMFGTRTMVPNPRGNPAVRIAEWDGSWAHQMFVDEFWDHPTEGEIFRIPNNWGPTAHGSPTGDEPAGGFYIKAATMDRICKTGEVFAFAGFQGFQARVIPWIF